MKPEPLRPAVYFLMRDGIDRKLYFDTWEQARKVFDNISGNPSSSYVLVDEDEYLVYIRMEHVVAVQFAKQHDEGQNSK